MDYEQVKKEVEKRIAEAESPGKVEQLEFHPYKGNEGIGYTIRLNGYRIIIIKED